MLSGEKVAPRDFFTVRPDNQFRARHSSFRATLADPLPILEQIWQNPALGQRLGPLDAPVLLDPLEALSPGPSHKVSFFFTLG